MKIKGEKEQQVAKKDESVPSPLCQTTYFTRYLSTVAALLIFTNLKMVGGGDVRATVLLMLYHVKEANAVFITKVQAVLFQQLL